MENEESVDEDPLPHPALDNLSNIGEEFSAASLCYPSKRVRLTQHCLKDNVTFFMGELVLYESAQTKAWKCSSSI